MVDDLLEHHHLPGKSRTEVVDLLGEPDKTDKFRNYEMVYWLGRERSAFALDSDWLVLKLSKGFVTEARDVTD